MYLRVSALLLISLISFISNKECDPKSLVHYKLVTETFWTRELFPKHFPDTRPVAQWSKLYGVSHNSNLSLFQIGTFANKNLKDFSEGGKTDTFENTLEHANVLSQFYAPPIRTGVGNTSASFFVNSVKSKVSFILKIHPSPDWFVGVDSLELCENGTWIENKTIHAEPIDAGTDQGFTFTAPDYANEEPESIFKINSTYPKESYGSFYYTNITALPSIARFVLTKTQEYKTNDNNEDQTQSGKEILIVNSFETLKAVNNIQAMVNKLTIQSNENIKKMEKSTEHISPSRGDENEPQTNRTIGKLIDIDGHEKLRVPGEKEIFNGEIELPVKGNKSVRQSKEKSRRGKRRDRERHAKSKQRKYQTNLYNKTRDRTYI